jgi:HlyD family secretion protein
VGANRSRCCRARHGCPKARSETAGHDVEVARSALLDLNRGQRQSIATVQVHAPVGGRVLHVLEQSERVIEAGTPLIELSNPSNLEVLIELLSTDAVKVKPDALVLIERWGGDTTLHARVRLVEPSAFTKISALGVEEQRVNVIADFTKPPQTLARRLSSGGRHRNLGKPRRAENSIERTVSHRRCVDRFRCRRRQGFRCHVVVGRRTPFDVEIISGLNEGAQIIVHPSNEVTEARAVITQSN